MAVDALRFVSLFMQGVEPTRDSVWQPATDIYRMPAGWLVKMELAGVRPDDVQLMIQGKSITVRGRRRDDCLEEHCCQLHMEIAYSRFERRIELPADLDSVHVETRFRDGMLMIKILRESCA
jgi:HSP20 family protein